MDVGVILLGRRRRHAELDRETELASLADRSLAPERRDAIAARVAASAELAERLAEQQRALALIRAAGAEVEAPATLRARIDAHRRPRRVPLQRGLVIGAAATAVAAVAIVFAVFTSHSAGPRYHVALAATALAPGARGDATLRKTSSGWRIELDASDLPRRSGGGFYEAWLRNDAGVLVPIGTFNEGLKVTLWAGVSPKHFTTLAVTRERVNGDQGSSGEKVLVGTVERGD